MKKRCIALLMMGGVLVGAVCLRLSQPAQEEPVQGVDCRCLAGFGVRQEVQQAQVYGVESFGSCSEASSRFR